MKLAAGFYEDLPRQEYDAVEALNFSRLKYMDRSAMAYRHNLQNPCEQTNPMKLCHAEHLAILQPTTAKFAVWEGGIRAGKYYKEWAETNAAFTQLTVKQAEHVFGMTKAIHANPVARKYLRYGKSELTMVWRDLAAKRDMKGVIDKLTDIDGEPVIVDLKTTRDCRSFKFGAQSFQLKTHAQLAHYQNGHFYLTGTLPRVVLVAVENEPPYDSAVYRVPTDVLRQGQEDLAKWLTRLAECETSGNWPGAEVEEQDLELPSYAYAGQFDMDDLEPIAR